MKVTPVPEPSGCAKQMFEAITAACNLPEGEIKNGLLKAITDSMMIIMCPMVVVEEKEIGK